MRWSRLPGRRNLSTTFPLQSRNWGQLQPHTLPSTPSTATHAHTLGTMTQGEQRRVLLAAGRSNSSMSRLTAAISTSSTFFFNFNQSLQDRTAARTIDGLISEVMKAWEEAALDMFRMVRATLQSYIEHTQLCGGSTPTRYPALARQSVSSWWGVYLKETWVLSEGVGDWASGARRGDRRRNGEAKEFDWDGRVQRR